MIECVNYNPEHYYRIKLRNCHSKERIADAEKITNARTILLDGKPVAIVGGIIWNAGVVLAWGLISDDVQRCSIGFFRAVRDLIESQFIAGLRRMVINVRVDYIVGYKFAKALGFQPEGIMRKYGDDNCDYTMMARVA